MQRNKYAKIELRPNKATKITITPEQIHPKYELRYETSSHATDTGHLKLFHLEPTEKGLPAFSARWDTKPNTIDIDLIGEASASQDFKAGARGHKGHHTTIFSDPPRIYQADIETPLGRVFAGKIALEIELGVYLQDSFEGLRDSIQERLRILLQCPHCGLVEVGAPLPQLVSCPTCGRSLSIAH